MKEQTLLYIIGVVGMLVVFGCIAVVVVLTQNIRQARKARQEHCDDFQKRRETRQAAFDDYKQRKGLS